MTDTLKIKIISRRPRTFWEKIYIIEVARGLLTTLTHLVKHLFGLEKMLTYEYPEQPKPIPGGYRAEHRLMKRPDGAVRCTACMLCATACPANCIEIVAAENPDPKIEKYPTVYKINPLKCIL